MILVIDAGNTSITTGLFEGNNLTSKVWFDSDKNLTADYYTNSFRKEFSDSEITGCIISSVVKELTPIIQNVVNAVFGIEAIILDGSLKTELKLDVENPKSVGADRIANCYAALKKYPLPAIVVDMGTATTFDIIDKTGAFTGGVIMPGVGLQLKTLGTNTSLLPELNVENIKTAVGHNTKECILSGVVKGHAHAVEGLLKECIQELGYNPTLIGTGGYIKLICSHMNSLHFDAIEPDLTLNGLKFIYDYIKQ